MRKLMIGAAVALAMAVPAAAQVQVPSGLVNVTVGNVVLENILTDVEIKALNDLDLLNNNAVLVQVPVGIAANVCNVSAAVLAKQAADAAPCTADNSTKSQGLAQAIRKQHLKK